MLRPRPLAILAIASLGLTMPAAAPASSAWWTTSGLDIDHDQIDDSLGPFLPGARVSVIVDFATQPGPADRAAVEAAGFLITIAPLQFPLLVAEGRAEDLPDLAQRPGVVLVEQDRTLEPQLRDSVPLVGAPRAWHDHGVTGKGIVIAVLDDGVYEQHPDFDGRIKADYGAARPDAGPLPSAGTLFPTGAEGHATHVAGTIIGPGTQSGGSFRGVAPSAEIVNVDIFNAPNQTTSGYAIKGLDWVLENKARYGIRIVSMSIGGAPTDGTDALSRAVDTAVERGLVVVVAAGNKGPGEKTITIPGVAKNAITVGAVDKQRRLADFSGRGPTPDGRAKPDLVAPGVDITSTLPPYTTGALANALLSREPSSVYYGSSSGTSMAAPHVSGVVALMLEANANLTPAQVKDILRVTATRLEASEPNNATGFGMVDAGAAVDVAHDPSLLASAAYEARAGEVGASTSTSETGGWLSGIGSEGRLALFGILGVWVVFGALIAIVMMVRRR